MAFHYSPNIVTNGLILYVDSANTKSLSGSALKDLAGKYGTLALSGTTYVNEAAGVLSFNGLVGSSASTTGTVAQTQEMTFDFWFNRTASTGANNIVLSIGGTPFFSFRSTNDFVFSYNTTSGASTTQQFLTSPLTYSNGVWYNVTCTLLRSNTTSISIMYVNGVSVASITAVNNSISIPGVLKIANFGSGSSTFNGKISNVKIYERVLNATEVLQNYNAIKSRFGF